MCENLAAFLGHKTSGLHTLKKLNAVDVKTMFVGQAGDTAEKGPVDAKGEWDELLDY